MAVHEVKAMLPGTFYRRPSPEAAAFKEVGDTVAKDDVIGLIEVMKSFHQVVAEADGTIKSFAVDDEEAIMPGMTVAEIEA